MVAVDETTIEYVKGRPLAPKAPLWDSAVAYWRTLKSDPAAKFDREVTLDAREIKPHVTWGTSPEMVVPVDDAVPDPEREKDATKREGMERASHGLKPRTKMTDIKLTDLHGRAPTAHRGLGRRRGGRGPRIVQYPPGVVVPGPGLVKAQAEKEGLDKVFRDAGQWREPAVNASHEPGQAGRGRALRVDLEP
jgi:3-isopropylmalate/(R)-2-methylmalate dehydratase large subunit